MGNIMKRIYPSYNQLFQIFDPNYKDNSDIEPWSRRSDLILEIKYSEFEKFIDERLTTKTKEEICYQDFLSRRFNYLLLISSAQLREYTRTVDRATIITAEGIDLETDIVLNPKYRTYPVLIARNLTRLSDLMKKNS